MHTELKAWPSSCFAVYHKKRTPTITHLYYRLLRWWCRFFKAAGYGILTSIEKKCKLVENSYYRTSTMHFYTIKYLSVLPSLCHHSMLDTNRCQVFSPNTDIQSNCTPMFVFWKAKPVKSVDITDAAFNLIRLIPLALCLFSYLAQISQLCTAR